MYLKYYNMKTDPFPMRPEVDAFFASPMHKNALELLMTSVQHDEPLILVHGEYGTGKTLICLKLIDFFHDTQKPYIFFPAMEIEWVNVLRKIADHVGVSYSAEPHTSELISKIYDHYHDHPDTPSVYLIFDDFQDIYTSYIYHIKKLINFNIVGNFPIKVILVAHSFVLEKIAKDVELAPFLQRLRRQILLPPLSESAMREYIYFRLFHAGAKGRPVFTDDALDIIKKRSRCIPRLVNNICNASLIMAAQKQQDQINADIVNEASMLYASEDTDIIQEQDDARSDFLLLNDVNEQQESSAMSYSEPYIRSEQENGVFLSNQPNQQDQGSTQDDLSNRNKPFSFVYLSIFLLAILLTAALTYIFVSKTNNDSEHTSPQVAVHDFSVDVRRSGAVNMPEQREPVSSENHESVELANMKSDRGDGSHAPVNYSYQYDTHVSEQATRSRESDSNLNKSRQDKIYKPYRQKQEHVQGTGKSKPVDPMTVPLANDFILPLASKDDVNGT